MKFGIMFANTGEFATPDGAVALARHCEAIGFESLWTVEHVVVPTGYQSRYPYSRDGRMPGTEENPIPDPLVWLAYVAGATERLRLATGILILPQRNPVVLAKELATLDMLSKGRLEVGIGVGWLREEFEALGVPFEERGARTDEYVDVLRRLWSEPATAYDGRFVGFGEVKSFPKPAQAGGPPIHVGGHSVAAARRAARLGAGFFPGRDLDTAIDALRAACAASGRDVAEIEVTVGGLPSLATVERYRERYGAARFVIPPMGLTMADAGDRLSRFADEVIHKLT